jgi:hypothetical protein
MNDLHDDKPLHSTGTTVSVVLAATAMWTLPVLVGALAPHTAFVRVNVWCLRTRKHGIARNDLLSDMNPPAMAEAKRYSVRTT